MGHGDDSFRGFGSKENTEAMVKHRTALGPSGTIFCRGFRHCFKSCVTWRTSGAVILQCGVRMLNTSCWNESGGYETAATTKATSWRSKRHTG